MRLRRGQDIGRVAAGTIARAYFELSYALLWGSAAGRRLLALTAAGDEPVHGYFTLEDRDVLFASLKPAIGDRLVDLGCGIGGIAIDIHRRSGAEIVGIDVSRRAIRAAIVRARAAGLAASVRFRPGDLAQPPPVGATSGYAIDSLMFLPSLAGALAAIGATLPPEAPLFATLLVAGRASEDRLRHSFDVVGVEVERLDDVTTALGQRSRRRAGMARALLREDTTVRGRMAMFLVLAEERIVGAAIARGRVRRWRFVIRYPVSPAC